jgi:hypothetical protein
MLYEVGKVTKKTIITSILLLGVFIAVAGTKLFITNQSGSSIIGKPRSITFFRNSQPGETLVFMIISRIDGIYTSVAYTIYEGEEPKPKESPLHKNNFETTWKITKNDLSLFSISKSELEKIKVDDKGHVYFYIIHGEDKKWYRIPIGSKLESLLQNSLFVKKHLDL